MSQTTRATILSLVAAVLGILTTLGVTQIDSTTVDWVNGVVGTALTLFALVVGHFQHKALAAAPSTVTGE
jgi:hypothetical protein